MLNQPSSSKHSSSASKRRQCLADDRGDRECAEPADELDVAGRRSPPARPAVGCVTRTSTSENGRPDVHDDRVVRRDWRRVASRRTDSTTAAIFRITAVRARRRNSQRRRREHARVRCRPAPARQSARQHAKRREIREARRGAERVIIATIVDARFVTVTRSGVRVVWRDERGEVVGVARVVPGARYRVVRRERVHQMKHGGRVEPTSCEQTRISAVTATACVPTMACDRVTPLGDAGSSPLV